MAQSAARRKAAAKAAAPPEESIKVKAARIERERVAAEEAKAQAEEQRAEAERVRLEEQRQRAADAEAAERRRWEKQSAERKLRIAARVAAAARLAEERAAEEAARREEEAARKRKRDEEKVRQALVRMSQLLQAKAFESWLGWLADTQRLRSLAARCVARLTQGLLARTFAAWSDLAAEETERRVEAERQAVEDAARAAGFLEPEPEPETGWALVRAKFGAKDKAEKDIIREVLTHLYLTVRPDKAGDVDGLLKEWEGEERLLLAKVRAKYAK